MLNLTSKTNSWIHKLPFDGRFCLEGHKREAFLVSLEYKAFLGTILVLASPIAISSPLFFIATGLPKKIQTNTAQQNKVLQLLIQLL